MLATACGSGNSTSSDSNGARIMQARWAGWDLGLEYEGEGATQDVASVRAMGLQVWAIACDLAVDITTGG